MKIAWFNGKKYAVRVVGKYSMIPPYDDLWRELGIDGEIEKGNVLPFDFDAIVQEPPTEAETIAQNEQQAKQTRDNSISADVEMYDEIYQVEHISSTIDKSEKIGASESDSIMYRLRNNLYRETTLAELREIDIFVIHRERDIWNQFGAWDNGNKLTPFEVV